MAAAERNMRARELLSYATPESVRGEPGKIITALDQVLYFAILYICIHHYIILHYTI
jgi:hypothetical protein